MAARKRFQNLSPITFYLTIIVGAQRPLSWFALQLATRNLQRVLRSDASTRNPQPVTRNPKLDIFRAPNFVFG